jgi:hypothetical protein
MQAKAILRLNSACCFADAVKEDMFMASLAVADLTDVLAIQGLLVGPRDGLAFLLSKTWPHTPSSSHAFE